MTAPSDTSPLTLWAVATLNASSLQTRRDTPLDVSKCHAEVTVTGRVTSWHQCPNKPVTARPMQIDRFDSKKGVATCPVCGTHKRVYDDGLTRAEEEAIARAQDNAFDSRREALLKDVPWADKVHPEFGRLGSRRTGRVVMPIEILELLMESYRPTVEEPPVPPAQGSIVAFVVRDGSRIRYQGTGRVKSIDARGVQVTDSRSSRRYIVPVEDTKPIEPKVPPGVPVTLP